MRFTDWVHRGEGETAAEEGCAMPWDEGMLRGIAEWKREQAPERTRKQPRRHEPIDPLASPHVGQMACAFVARDFGISTFELMSASLERSTLTARRVVFQILHERARWPHREIARLVRCEPQTVQRGLQAIRAARKFDLALNERILKLTRELVEVVTGSSGSPPGRAVA